MQVFTDLYDRVQAARAHGHTHSRTRAQADCGSGNYFFTMISARWRTQTPCIWSQWSQWLAFLQEEHPETRAAGSTWPIYLCFDDKSLHRSLSRISSTIFKQVGSWCLLVVHVSPWSIDQPWLSLTVFQWFISLYGQHAQVLLCSEGLYLTMVPPSSITVKEWWTSFLFICFTHWALIKQITCPLVTRLFDFMLLSTEKELIIRLQNSPHPTFSPLIRNNPINFWTRVIVVNVISCH